MTKVWAVVARNRFACLQAIFASQSAAEDYILEIQQIPGEDRTFDVEMHYVYSEGARETNR